MASNYIVFTIRDQGPLLGTWSIIDSLRWLWRHAQLMADQFWQHQLREYLSTLRHQQNEICCLPQLIFRHNVGQLYPMHCNQWPLALVTKMIPSDDGLVSRVQLKSSKGSLTLAPVHLCLPECDFVRLQFTISHQLISAATTARRGECYCHHGSSEGDQRSRQEVKENMHRHHRDD